MEWRHGGQKKAIGNLLSGEPKFSMETYEKFTSCPTLKFPMKFLKHGL